MLVADDNSEMRALLAEMFRPLVGECVEAENGEVALRQCTNGSFDLALLDVRMPVLDGIEAASRISTIDPHILIVMVTEYDDDEYRAAAHTAGAAGYFLKENLMQLQEYIRSRFR